MKKGSICCGVETRIGYYSDGDINSWIVVANIGTYCTKCDKLCNYYTGKKIHKYDGTIIEDNQKIRKEKLKKLNG
jgi:hypothetical protein